MKLDIPEIQHTPFVSIPRFAEMTGLSKRQIVHLIHEGYLPAFKISNGKQTSRSHFINLLKIQTTLIQQGRDPEINFFEK